MAPTAKPPAVAQSSARPSTIISTTPNSPIVCANPRTPAVRSPGRASGTATVQKASQGEALSVGIAVQAINTFRR
jgi:hypothetical protein